MDSAGGWDVNAIPSIENIEECLTDDGTLESPREKVISPDVPSERQSSVEFQTPREAFSAESTAQLEHRQNNGMQREEVGFFGTIGNLFRNLFHQRRGGLGTPRISPESGSKFLNPVVSTSKPTLIRTMKSDKSNTINMKTFGAHDSRNFHQEQVGQAYQKSNDTPFTPDYPAERDSTIRLPRGSMANDMTLYSVNSAGDPVPITIQESGNDLDSICSSDEEHDDKDGFKAQLQPKFTWSKCVCQPEQLAIDIWRKTYKPDSNFIYYWLMLVTLAVLYNLWIIPLRAGFIKDVQTPWQNVWFAFDAICDVIYIVDIVIKFRTRIIRGGVYVKEMSQLNKLHRREWSVVLDFISVFPTDLFFIKEINPYYRLNRVARLYRAYTFYRAAELKTLWPNILRIANLFHMVVTILHYNSCIYYAASVANGYGTLLSNWAYPDPSLYPDYASLTRQYTYSFYWSIRELTIIGGRPLPETDWQFAYSIYLNLAGISLSSFIIGYVTVLLLGTNSEKLDFEHAMKTTRHFLKKRRLPKELRQRVEHFYNHLWRNSEFGHLDETALLRHLPISIKEEISLHSNYAALKQLSMFSSCDSNVVRDLVIRMKRRTYLPGQFIYRNGDAGSEMFIVGEGVLQIVRERDGDVTTVKEGDVFGEMNIFNLRKNHRRSCDVISCGFSELYVLTSEDVDEVLSKYPRVMKSVLQQVKRNGAMNRGVSANLYRKPTSSAFYTRLDNLDYVESVSNVRVGLKSRPATKPSGKSNGKQSEQGGLKWNSFNLRDDSPDSGMPPSPARRQISEQDGNAFASVPPGGLGMIIRPDIAEKLNDIYQNNLMSLQRSIDSLWQNEVATLQQQLSYTEAERDNRAREVIRLRQRASKTENKLVSSESRPDVSASQGGQKDVYNNSERRKSSILAEEDIFTTAQDDAFKSNTKTLTRNNERRRRTVLPTKTTSTASLKSTSSDAAITSNAANQSRKTSLIQETALDVYGSLASVK